MTIDEIIEIAKEYGWQEVMGAKDVADCSGDDTVVCRFPIDEWGIVVPPISVALQRDDDAQLTEEWMALIGWYDMSPDHYCKDQEVLHIALKQVIWERITRPVIRRGIAQYLRTTLAPESQLSIEVDGVHRLFSVDDLCRALED